MVLGCQGSIRSINGKTKETIKNALKKKIYHHKKCHSFDRSMLIYDLKIVREEIL